MRVPPEGRSSLTVMLLDGNTKTFSNDHRLCDILSFHRFHDEICKLFELQILHTMEVKHVISHLLHRAIHVQNISTCEVSLSQF